VSEHSLTTGFRRSAARFARACSFSPGVAASLATLLVGKPVPVEQQDSQPLL